jgi:phosphate-selective porin OprO/OprP
LFRQLIADLSVSSPQKHPVRRRFGRRLLRAIIGAIALQSSEEGVTAPVVKQDSADRCIAYGESPSDMGQGAERSMESSGGQCTGGSPPWAVTRWDWSWQGWDGLHYHFFRQNRSGWIWTRDEEKPAFPSLFLDRVDVAGKIGGRVDLDAAFFVNGGGMDPQANQVEVRRWRFYATGDAILLVPFSYSVNVMAVNGDRFVLDDVFLEFKRIPYVGNFKLGAFIPSISLEASGSSRDATFMEWGTPIQALAPQISAGWQMWRDAFDERVTWNVGQIFPSVGTDVGDATKDFFRNIARVTWLPIIEASPEKLHPQRLLHLGLDLNYLRSGDGQIRYQSRPESHLAPFLADTGFIGAEDMKSFGIEAAWVDGPWSFQGEYLHNFVSAGQTGSFYGFYAYGSYFLTGESRPYDRHKGIFGRLKPERNFSFGGEGYGALETAVRFSYLDLDDGPVKGGVLRAVTAGVNWYLHDHSKIRFNYVFSHASGGPREGDLHVFESRFEFDF